MQLPSALMGLAGGSGAHGSESHPVGPFLQVSSHGLPWGLLPGPEGPRYPRAGPSPGAGVRRAAPGRSSSSQPRGLRLGLPVTFHRARKPQLALASVSAAGLSPAGGHVGVWLPAPRLAACQLPSVPAGPRGVPFFFFLFGFRTCLSSNYSRHTYCMTSGVHPVSRHGVTH